MYKMLVLDMDGTLLDNNKTIPVQNITAVKRAIAAGIKVVISTGRSFLGVIDYLKELNIVSEDEYTITCAGGIIVNNTNSRIIHGSFFSANEINLINSVAKKLDININAYTKDRLLIERETYYNTQDILVNGLVETIVDFSHIIYEDVAKITLFTEGIEIVKFFKNEFTNIDIPIKPQLYKEAAHKNILSDFRIPKEIYNCFNVMKTSPYTFEITRKGASKGSAVKALSNILGIKREEIICIGDSGNDKQMIEYAGLGVAMGNAYPEIKDIADYITLSNDDNGVAHVVNKFIFEDIA